MANNIFAYSVINWYNLLCVLPTDATALLPSDPDNKRETVRIDAHDHDRDQPRRDVR